MFNYDDNNIYILILYLFLTKLISQNLTISGGEWLGWSIIDTNRSHCGKKKPPQKKKNNNKKDIIKQINNGKLKRLIKKMVI